MAMRVFSAIAAALTLTVRVLAADDANTFDYIIVGGGVSGLLLANRLSADPSTTVAIIEPGTDQRNNVKVSNPTLFLQTIRSPVDWAYQSLPQPQLNGRTLLYSGGKGFGGSSLINGMVYIRGEQTQYDAWEQLGNPGWNWDNLYPVFKSLEQFFPPDARQVSAGGSYTPSFHGSSGSVHVGFNPAITGGAFFGAAKAAWAQLGVPHVDDFNGGSVRGFSAHQQTIDPDQNLRWDAARAFYWPIAPTRKNIKLYSGPGTRIVWKAGTTNGKMVASGIVHHPNGGPGSFIIKANKEVILCAGALRTPMILEQSGIGNASYVKSLGIGSVVDLPGVGQGLDDQPNTGINYGSTLPETNYTAHTTFVNAHDIFGDDFDNVAATALNSIPQWAAQLAAGNAAAAAAYSTHFQMQYDLIFKQNSTLGEILTTIGSGTLGIRYWNLLPFSRGSVHLQANNNFKYPGIDPKFFTIDFDSTVQTAIGRFANQMFQTPPFSQYVTSRKSPSTSVLPEHDATDAQWDAFHRSTAGSISHPIGTAAMKRRDLLGVVDPSLKVYGTGNVRVVDASVLPTQISGHLMAICYAVAERASQFILGS